MEPTISQTRRSRERKNALQREWRRNNPDRRFAQDLKYKFGITVEEYQRLVEKYSGACWICRKVPDTYLCVDHCHTTGRVRGVLCTNCNAGIGNLKEDTDTILNALAYLGVQAIVE